MKKCTKCKKFLSYSKFNVRAISNDGLSSWCKNCLKKSQFTGTLYSNHSIIVMYVYNMNVNSICVYSYITSSCKTCEKKRRERAKKISHNLKLNGCAICGYDKCDAALEFHHVNPEDKKFNITNKKILANQNISTELNKCILLCANCHREAHYRLLTETKNSI